MRAADDAIELSAADAAAAAQQAGYVADHSFHPAGTARYCLRCARSGSACPNHAGLRLTYLLDGSVARMPDNFRAHPYPYAQVLKKVDHSPGGTPSEQSARKVRV